MYHIEGKDVANFASFHPNSTIGSMNRKPMLPLRKIAVAFCRAALQERKRSDFHVQENNRKKRSDKTSIYKKYPLYLHEIYI
ncbi:hypothetical protein DW941_02645 [Phocaeicola plebeius]|nr:hypothetical protein DW941_02645 [Phocaeicola plebeius]